MNLGEHLRRATCTECGWYSVWGPEEMAQQLRQQGKLRREAKPDPAVVLELLEPLLCSIICPDCHATGIQLSPLEDDPEDWGDARHCEICNAVIPAERVEIFPNVTRCVNCQDKPAPASSEDDYCPRCGGLVRIKAMRAGVTRYVIHCSSCGYRS